MKTRTSSYVWNLPVSRLRQAAPASGYGQHFKKSYLSEQRTQKTTLPCSNPSAGSAGRRAACICQNTCRCQRLNRQLQSFGFGKYYQAVLLGCPQTADGILEDYLVKDGRTNTSRICTEETPGAKVARLSYHIAKTTAEFSLAEIHLDTGRHHQIRVQMAHLAVPSQETENMIRTRLLFPNCSSLPAVWNSHIQKQKSTWNLPMRPVLRVFADETPADHPVG